MGRIVAEFSVWGQPQTAGSKRAFARKRKDGGVFATVVDDNPKSREWKEQVSSAAFNVVGAMPLVTGPLAVEMSFTFVRPKGHYGTGRNAGALKGDAPRRHTGRPDVLKLARAIEDSLTGVVYRDDSQIVEEVLRKEYGERAGVKVVVMEL